MARTTRGNDKVLVRFTMKASEVSALEKAAERLGITTTEFVARALADEMYLQEKLDAGAVILVKDAGGRISEVTLR